MEKNKDKNCCIECKGWFVDIKSHMRNKHNKAKVGCNICQTSPVFTVSGLQRHKKLVHGTKKNEPKLPKVLELPKTLFSVAPARLIYDSKRKKVTNEKGDKVPLQITLDPNGYIEIPSDDQIGNMEKIELKKYILAMSKESNLLLSEINANKEYIKIPTDSEMDMVEKIVLEQHLRDLFEESIGLRKKLDSKTKNPSDEIRPSLHLAAENGVENLEIPTEMSKSPFDLTIENQPESLIDKRKGKNSRTKNGKTPLHTAAIKTTEIVRIPLETAESCEQNKEIVETTIESVTNPLERPGFEITLDPKGQ